MKKIFFSRLFSLLTLTLLMSLFIYTSCEKEEKECKAIITAKFLSDTMVVVPNAGIIIEKGDIYINGVTNNLGQFTNTFPLEAILDVYAVIDTSSFDSLVYEYTGSTVIRLQPGETIYRSVFLSQ